MAERDEKYSQVPFSLGEVGDLRSIDVKDLTMRMIQPAKRMCMGVHSITITIINETTTVRL